MGLFFEDTKPPEQAAPPQPARDWLTALIDGVFFTARALMVGVLAVLAFILKPIFMYLLTFDGRTREQIRNQVIILALLIGVPSYMVYRIPAVQDLISLKNTRTINLSNGFRIVFPDRANFVVRDVRSVVYNDGSRIYISYAGYTKNTMQKMLPGQCQLVPRSHFMGFSSLRPPVQAEGFEEAVTYPVSVAIPDLHGWRYASTMLTNPGYWFKRKEELASITIEYEVSAPWSELVENWDNAWSPPRMNGYKPFEVKALAREHAVICF